MDKLQKPELLIPAGSLEVLKVAVDYGADAVYIGGKNYGLRAKAGNFTIEEMHEAADYVHAHGAKLYVTVNIFAHNEDIDGIKAYFHELKETGLEEKIDAFIISDPGIFTLAKEILPGIEIHVSTQANNTNYLIYDFWRKQGATRVVAARELSLKEIKTIREHIPADMDRGIYAWSDVYILFRKMPAQQLFYRQRCKSGSLHASMPLEICGCGGEATGRISSSGRR